MQLVVLKGIEPDVTSKEVIDALKEKGFSAKNVSNIISRKKEPQPLFRVELEPDSRVLKKNEVHPLYNLQYLLHRRINMEEPHKRNGPVQCTNSQEYGHSHDRSNIATSSPEWLKKVEWARNVLPNYGQDKPTQDGAQAKRQRSKIQPSVSFAEITKDRVYYSVSCTRAIRRAGFPRTSVAQWSPSFSSFGAGEARYIILLHGRGLVPGQRQGGGLR